MSKQAELAKEMSKNKATKFFLNMTKYNSDCLIINIKDYNESNENTDRDISYKLYKHNKECFEDNVKDIKEVFGETIPEKLEMEIKETSNMMKNFEASLK